MVEVENQTGPDGSTENEETPPAIVGKEGARPSGLVRVGDRFAVRHKNRTDTFRREVDDPAPRFDCERIRVTHLTSSTDARLRPYTFGTESEWFTQRGLRVA